MPVRASKKQGRSCKSNTVFIPAAIDRGLLARPEGIANSTISPSDFMRPTLPAADNELTMSASNTVHLDEPPARTTMTTRDKRKRAHVAIRTSANVDRPRVRSQRTEFDDSNRRHSHSGSAVSTTNAEARLTCRSCSWQARRTRESQKVCTRCFPHTRDTIKPHTPRRCELHPWLVLV